MTRINDGRLQAGMNAAQEALTISKELGNTWGQVDSYCQLAMGALESGAYTEALDYAQHAISVARTHGLMLLIIGLILLGKVQRAMLDLEAALATHLAVMEMKELSAPLTEMIADELCADYAASGEWTNAHTYAIQAVNNRVDSAFLYMGLTRWYETEALVRAGEIERATRDAEHFGELFGKSGRRRIPYLRSLAVLAQVSGETDAAVDHLHEAAALAEKIGLLGEIWSIEAALGDLHQSRGEKSQAQTAFARAAEIVRTLATNIQDEQQRLIFLSAQQVRHVLE